MSSSPTDPGVYERMINSLLPCSHIYSKEYRHGTLFGLMFLKQTYVTDMDAQIVEIDQKLRHNGPTKFTSICDILSGKIKSFGKNKRETLVDEHYNVIFKPLSGKKVKPQDGVNVWINPSIPNQGVQVPTAADEGVQVPTAADEDEDDSEDEVSDAQDAGQKRASEGDGGAPPSKRTKTSTEDEIQAGSVETTTSKGIQGKVVDDTEIQAETTTSKETSLDEVVDDTEIQRETTDEIQKEPVSWDAEEEYVFDCTIVGPNFEYERVNKNGEKEVVMVSSNGPKRMMMEISRLPPGDEYTYGLSKRLSGPPAWARGRTVVPQATPMDVVVVPLAAPRDVAVVSLAAPRDLAISRASIVQPVVLVYHDEVTKENTQLKEQLAECEKQKAAAYKQCEEQAESISVYELKVLFIVLLLMCIVFDGDFHRSRISRTRRSISGESTGNGAASSWSLQILWPHSASSTSFFSRSMRLFRNRRRL